MFNQTAGNESLLVATNEVAFLKIVKRLPQLADFHFDQNIDHMSFDFAANDRAAVVDHFQNTSLFSKYYESTTSQVRLWNVYDSYKVNLAFTRVGVVKDDLSKG